MRDARSFRMHDMHHIIEGGEFERLSMFRVCFAQTTRYVILQRSIRMSLRIRAVVTRAEAEAD